jgi:hypothetical protein
MSIKSRLSNAWASLMGKRKGLGIELMEFKESDKFLVCSSRPLTLENLRAAEE